MKQQTLTDDEFALVLRALGHPIRVEIMRILSGRSQNCCCNDVTECLSLAQSTVSQHLKVLLDAGVIMRETQGTRNNYKICADRLIQVERMFASLHVAPACSGSVPQASVFEKMLESTS